MSFIFGGFIGASITLAILYFILLIYIIYNLYRLNQNDKKFHLLNFNNYNDIDQINNKKSHLNTKKLFVMNCLLSCLLRFMSFSSMAVFDISAIHYSISTSTSKGSYDDNITGTEEFFEKTFFVLFNFPDFCFISAYFLLVVVWGEVYLQSRRHWLSSISFRSYWLLSYLIFNIFLYGCQLSLYSLVFLPSFNKDILSAFIFLTLTAFNLLLPILWVLVFVYLSIRFSGFPYSSSTARRRLTQLGLIVTMWTASRIFWGILTLTSVMQGWLNQLSVSTLAHTFILIFVFVLAEICPILYSLQSTVLSSLSDSNILTNNSSHIELPNLSESDSKSYNSLDNQSYFTNFLITPIQTNMDTIHENNPLSPDSDLFYYNNIKEENYLKSLEKNQHNHSSHNSNSMSTLEIANDNVPDSFYLSSETGSFVSAKSFVSDNIMPNHHIMMYDNNSRSLDSNPNRKSDFMSYFKNIFQ